MQYYCIVSFIQFSQIPLAKSRTSSIRTELLLGAEKLISVRQVVCLQILQ